MPRGGMAQEGKEPGVEMREHPPLAKRVVPLQGGSPEPRRGVTYQPRAEPWVFGGQRFGALKGRDIDLVFFPWTRRYVSPFQGSGGSADRDPGRCPGLVFHALSGLGPTIRPP